MPDIDPELWMIVHGAPGGIEDVDTWPVEIAWLVWRGILRLLQRNKTPRAYSSLGVHGALRNAVAAAGGLPQRVPGRLMPGVNENKALADALWKYKIERRDDPDAVGKGIWDDQLAPDSDWELAGFLYDTAYAWVNANHDIKHGHGVGPGFVGMGPLVEYLLRAWRNGPDPVREAAYQSVVDYVNGPEDA